MTKTKRYSISEQEKILHEYAKSGLTKEEFCERHNLPYTTFKNWPWRSGLRKKKSDKSLEFAKVALADCNVSTPKAETRSLKLIFPNQICMELPVNLPPAILKNILSMTGVCND
jgi:hypothetical protein